MTYQPEQLPGMTDVDLRVASFASQATLLDAAAITSEADKNAISLIQDRVWHDYHEDIIAPAQAAWLGIVGMLAERPGELHTKKQLRRDSDGNVMYPYIDEYVSFFLNWKFLGQSILDEGTVATVTTVNAHLALDKDQMQDVERALGFAAKPPKTAMVRAMDRTLIHTAAIKPPKLGVIGKQRKLRTFKNEIDAFMLDNIGLLSIRTTAELLGSTTDPKQVYAMKVTEPENLPRPELLDPEHALLAKQRFVASKSLVKKIVSALASSKHDDAVNGKDVAAFEDWLREEAYKNTDVSRIEMARELLVKSS